MNDCYAGAVAGEVPQGAARCGDLAEETSSGLPIFHHLNHEKWGMVNNVNQHNPIELGPLTFSNKSISPQQREPRSKIRPQ